MTEIFNTQYNVALSDVDCFNRLKISAFMNYMQDAASRHADLLGVGYETLIKQDLTWFMTKVIVEVDSYPSFGEDIHIETWPKTVDKLTSTRDFVIRNDSGDVIARATTIWAMLNMATKRPERLEEYVPMITPDMQKSAIDEKPGRINLPEVGFSDSKDFVVPFSAIDYNQHLNNARYFDFILDMFDQDYHEHHVIRRVQLNFLHEVKCSEHLYIRMTTPENGHCLLEADKHTGATDKQPVFHASVIWK